MGTPSPSACPGRLPAGLLAVAALAALAAADASAGLGQEAGAAVGDDPLVPDSVLAVPGGTALVFEEAAGLPVAGIRVSAPLDSARPDDARVLVALALERARPFADLVGASLWAGVEGGRMAYQVIGDRADLEELAWTARVLTARPVRRGLRQATERERARADRLAETPHGRVVAAAEADRAGWAGAAGRSGAGVRASPPPNLGGPGYDEEVHFRRIERLWAETHARDRLRVFVLGAASVPVALSELSLLGAPPSTRAAAGRQAPLGRPAAASASAAPSAGAEAPPPAPAWAGAHFSLGPPDSPRSWIAREALSAGLAELALPGVSLQVESGLGGGAGRLAITATAMTQPAADVAVAEALALLSEPELSARWNEAAQAVRGGLLAAAATPAGWLSLADASYGRDRFLRGALSEVRLAGPLDRQAVAADFESSLVRLDGRGQASARGR